MLLLKNELTPSTSAGGADETTVGGCGTGCAGGGVVGA